MKKQESKKGITLIALIITIIVLLILAGVSINMVLGDNGVITKALDASDKTKTESVYETVSMAWGSCEMEYEDAWSTDQSVKRSTYFTKEKMNEYLNSEGEITEDFTYNEDDDTELKYKSSDGTEYMIKVDKTGKVSKNVVVYLKVGEEEVAITKGNLWQYLGRTVINYTGGTSLAKDESLNYEISGTYRLFYIDFDNDYIDGEGTIYLKADTSTNYSLQTLSEDKVKENNKYMIFNRKWSLSGTTTLTNNNQKAVAWLLEPSVWDSLKDETLSSSINYVVGAPSLEMYVDSYNTYLTGYNRANPTAKLTTCNPDDSEIVAEKLKCKYVNSGDAFPNDISGSYYYSGYVIGLEDESENIKYGTQYSGSKKGYYTDDFTLISSTGNNGNQVMYNPGNGKYYWLASPSAAYSCIVMFVLGNYGSVSGYNYNYSNSLCPLVSLKSDVTLTLANN
jgi:flagellar basal body-associated protein FliL